MSDSLPPPLSPERDGEIWLARICSDSAQLQTWLARLTGAELAGKIGYRQLAASGLLPHWAQEHAEKISRQEAMHYSMAEVALRRLEGSIVMMPHEETLAELDLNERRSLMRLTTILRSRKAVPGWMRVLAERLVADEAYHVWFTGELFKDIGNITLPRQFLWLTADPETEDGRLTTKVTLRPGVPWPGRPWGEDGLLWIYRSPEMAKAVEAA